MRTKDMKLGTPLKIKENIGGKQRGVQYTPKAFINCNEIVGKITLDKEQRASSAESNYLWRDTQGKYTERFAATTLRWGSPH